MKKTESQTQYPNPTKPDPTFKEQVFQRGNNKIGNIGKYFLTKYRLIILSLIKIILLITICVEIAMQDGRNTIQVRNYCLYYFIFIIA